MTSPIGNLRALPQAIRASCYWEATSPATLLFNTWKEWGLPFHSRAISRELVVLHSWCFPGHRDLAESKQGTSPELSNPAQVPSPKKHKCISSSAARAHLQDKKSIYWVTHVHSTLTHLRR